MYDSRWHRQLMGWLAGLTLENEVRRDLSLSRVVCKYEDVFLDEPPGLPQHRDVDFIIEFTIKISISKDILVLRFYGYIEDISVDIFTRISIYQKLTKIL